MTPALLLAAAVFVSVGPTRTETFRWEDPNPPDAGVVGFFGYIGQSSRNYTRVFDLGLPPPVDGVYSVSIEVPEGDEIYAALTAYRSDGEASDYSNEVYRDPCTEVVDTDGDGVCDVIDNCSTVPNAAPMDCDTDADGFGNACDADFDQDGIVAVMDFTRLAGDYGEVGDRDTDQDCNRVVGILDFSDHFALQFGGPPGPSGLWCAGTIPCGGE